MKAASKNGLNYLDLEGINQELGSYIGEGTKLEEMQILQKAMCRIDSEYRSLIVMSRYHKMKYREIADITGSNENAVKAKLFRAMNKLREAYFSIQNQ
jgi:RNA polymerase sigma factor (sigma-70 family)